MRFHFDDDVTMVLLDLGDCQEPVILDQLISLRVYFLKEHISLVVDLVVAEEGSEDFLHIEIFQVACIKHYLVTLSD